MTHPSTKENFISGLVDGNHDDHSISAGMSKVVQPFTKLENVSSWIRMNKNKPYVVGQGFRLPLSVQGNKDEQLIFHPAHMEYVRAPHPAQY